MYIYHNFLIYEYIPYQKEYYWSKYFRLKGLLKEKLKTKADELRKVSQLDGTWVEYL